MVSLTAAGKLLYPGVQTGFVHLREAVAGLKQSDRAFCPSRISRPWRGRCGASKRLSNGGCNWHDWELYKTAVRLSSDYSEIKIRLKFEPAAPAPNFERDWNKPPTMPMLVAIRSIDGKRVPKMMRWGLLPHWAKDEKLSFSTFNARSEDFTTKPAFRDAWKRRQRCLVITDGFYEWKKLSAKDKQPYAIAMADDGQMVMAGLWASWRSPTNGEGILSCTILTCHPNNTMAELHDRMPVILAKSDWPAWLGEEPASEQELLVLLKPCPDAALKIWPVDKRVGNVRNQGPELLRNTAESSTFFQD